MRVGKRGERELTSFLSTIYGVPSVGIRRDKKQSSSPRRGLCAHTKNGEFHRRSKGGRFREIKDFGLRRLPNRATTLQEVGILPT